MRWLLLRTSWITGIKPVEECLTTLCFHVALGALAAGRSTVTLIRTRGRERAVATEAQDAARNRAHALWAATNGT